MPLSLQKLEVNGLFDSATKGSFSAGAKLTIDNATSFDTFGYLDHESTAFAYVQLDSYTLSDADVSLLTTAVSDAGAPFSSTSYFDFYGYNGSYQYVNYYNYDPSDQYPEDVGDISIDGYLDSLPNLEADIIAAAQGKFSGTVEASKIEWLDYSSFRWEDDFDTDTGTYTEARSAYGVVKVSFPYFESADNFVKGSLTVTAKANVPELPEAAVIATVNRTELTGGDASVIVSYNGQRFTLSLDSEDFDADEPEATLTLSNPDGVKLIVNLSETVEGGKQVLGGKLFVDGTQVGTVSETDSGIPLVRYTNGEFESLY